VIRKRPYLTIKMCRSVIDKPLASEVQPDARIRYWGEVTLPGEASARILRVVTLEDGTTVHNAFLDRGYKESR
jgi:hypothetical protein